MVPELFARSITSRAGRGRFATESILALLTNNSLSWRGGCGNIMASPSPPPNDLSIHSNLQRFQCLTNDIYQPIHDTIFLSIIAFDSIVLSLYIFTQTATWHRLGDYHAIGSPRSIKWSRGRSISQQPVRPFRNNPENCIKY